MPIQSKPVLGIESNGLSPWTHIPPGKTKVWIGYDAGASATVQPRVTHKPDDPDRIFPVLQADVQISATSNRVFDVSGPAFVAFEVSGLSGTLEVLFQAAEAVG